MPTYGENSRPDKKALVLETLNAKLENLTKTEVPKWKKQLSTQTSEDVYSMYLKAKHYEVLKLKEEIIAFENPDRHFTKTYRTFEGHCNKLQTDLDRMDVYGRDELRDRRKKAYVDLDEIINVLSSKAHKSGKLCKDCEIKN